MKLGHDGAEMWDVKRRNVRSNAFIPSVGPTEPGAGKPGGYERVARRAPLHLEHLRSYARAEVSSLWSLSKLLLDAPSRVRGEGCDAANSSAAVQFYDRAVAEMWFAESSPFSSFDRVRASEWVSPGAPPFRFGHLARCLSAVVGTPLPRSFGKRVGWLDIPGVESLFTANAGLLERLFDDCELLSVQWRPCLLLPRVRLGMRRGEGETKLPLAAVRSYERGGFLGATLPPSESTWRRALQWPGELAWPGLGLRRHSTSAKLVGFANDPTYR